MASFFVIIFVVLFLYSSLQAAHEENLIPLHGRHAEVDGIEMVYEYPSDSVKAVLFVAHGCSHSATDWWPISKDCPKCTGLPVEVSIVKEALKRKFAVLAVSSNNRVHKCWSGKDTNRVTQALSHFYKNILPSGSSNVPLYLLGASSGGSFVGYLAQQSTLQPPVSALCVQISAVGGDRIAALPPTIFVLMSRDTHTYTHVQSIASSITRSKVLVTEPRPIHPEYFAHKAAGFITAAESRAVQSALLTGGFISNSTFLLMDDPRQTNWREVVSNAVPSFVPSRDSLIADQSAISELLNLAWDMHEITDDFNKEVFDWFEEFSKNSLSTSHI